MSVQRCMCKCKPPESICFDLESVFTARAMMLFLITLLGMASVCDSYMTIPDTRGVPDAFHFALQFHSGHRCRIRRWPYLVEDSSAIHEKTHSTQTTSSSTFNHTGSRYDQCMVKMVIRPRLSFSNQSQYIADYWRKVAQTNLTDWLTG